MADISFLSIKIFVEVSKISKNGKRILYIVLKVLSNEKIKNYCHLLVYTKVGLQYYSFCDQSRNFANVNSKF
jgi:hypothetical protein